MLLTKEVEVKWENRTKTYYESLGYIYTKNGDIFTVKIEHVLPYNQSPIEILCDYCKKGIKRTKYNIYHKSLKDGFIKKDCCSKCKRLKTQESMLAQHGCTHINNTHIKFDDIKESFKLMNYTPLFDEYSGQLVDLPYICNKHADKGIQFVKYKYFKKTADSCEYCRIENKSGEKSWSWRGGTTPLHEKIRIQMSKWLKDSRKNSNYKCVLTGEDSNIVHHLYSFNSIVKEAFELIELNWYDMCNVKISEIPSSTLDEIKEVCLKLHYHYGLGICLSEKIHVLFHSLYGNGNNTPEQFEEFKKRYFSGEFTEIEQSSQTQTA